METIEKVIDIDLPAAAVYDQWMHFEDFPHFMEGIREVTALDENRLLWKAVIAGREKEWEAQIVDRVPGQRITWQSVNGAKNFGTLSFMPMGPVRTRLTLSLSYAPDGIAETIADFLGVVSTRVSANLQHFKEFVEMAGASTEDWTGRANRGGDANNLPRRSALERPGTNAATPSDPFEKPEQAQGRGYWSALS